MTISERQPTGPRCNDSFVGGLVVMPSKISKGLICMRLLHAMSAVNALPRFLTTKGIDSGAVSQIIVDPQNLTSHPVKVLLLGTDNVRKIGNHEIEQVLHEDGYTNCYTAYSDSIQFTAYEHCMTDLQLPF